MRLVPLILTINKNNNIGYIRSQVSFLYTFFTWSLSIHLFLSDLPKCNTNIILLSKFFINLLAFVYFPLLFCYQWVELILKEEYFWTLVVNSYHFPFFGYFIFENLIKSDMMSAHVDFFCSIEAMWSSWQATKSFIDELSKNMKLHIVRLIK